MGKTIIPWTDYTWNPWWGCVKVSEGCANCYAETLANRFSYDVWGKNKPRRFFPLSHMNQLKTWNHKAIKENANRRVFIGSMMDVFEENKTEDDSTGMTMNGVRDILLSTLPEYKNLSFLLLTKRIENAKRMVPEYWVNDNFKFWPTNVRVGCTIENNKRFDERIEYLIEFPYNFISFEPLLEEITLDRIKYACQNKTRWMIVGGESGHGARPFSPAWASSIVAYGDAYNVPVFVKQMGTVWANKVNAKSSKGEDMSEWNEFLQVRQFPIEPWEILK